MTTDDRRVALITGASRGIGAATAQELASNGFDVVLTARSASALEDVADSIRKNGGHALAVASDATDLSSLEALVERTIGEVGRIDVLVNNAGYLPDAHPLCESTRETWEATLAVNLRAPWYLSNLVYPHMKAAGGGAIVNVTSSAGIQPEIGLGVYGVSKAGVISLTRIAAREWARDNIRVTAVAPGLTDTEMAAPLSAYLTKRGKPLSLLGDVIEPAEVARLIDFIVSDRGRHMTGGVVTLDAGHTL